MAVITLNAEKRTKLGGATAKQLRRLGRVPGVVYGHGEDSIAFHVKDLDLRPLIYTHETHTINLNVAGKSTNCILREIQFHPVTDRVSHIDLVALHAGEKLKVDVPVSLVGTAAGVKDGGVIDFVMHKLSVECLPDAIPSHIDVDVTDLRIGHSIHISDISAGAGYTIVADGSAVIVTCAAPKTAEATEGEAAAATETITEPEQIKAKGKKDEEE
jgi:large subunit ribosomal protein L25